MGTNVMPSGSRRDPDTSVSPESGGYPNWSGLPSSSSRAVPEAITSRASRMTAGSAHAPPIQPCSSPSAVMIARAPCWLDEGPCRQTTVACANASPRRASSAACCMIPQLSTASSLIIRPDGRGARYVTVVGQRLPHPVRQQRHVDVADAGARQRVDYRVDEGSRAADGGALADALSADRVVRAGGHDLAVQLEAGRLPGGGQQVVHVVRADAV